MVLLVAALGKSDKVERQASRARAGAKKKGKKLFHTYPAPSLPMEGDSYFTLAQRKYQRDIHPHRAAPYIGRA
jgi:hypothetical protein